jgi:hypothetical protein
VGSHALSPSPHLGRNTHTHTKNWVSIYNFHLPKQLLYNYRFFASPRPFRIWPHFLGANYRFGDRFTTVPAKGHHCAFASDDCHSESAGIWLLCQATPLCYSTRIVNIYGSNSNIHSIFPHKIHVIHLITCTRVDRRPISTERRRLRGTSFIRGQGQKILVAEEAAGLDKMMMMRMTTERIQNGG